MGVFSITDMRISHRISIAFCGMFLLQGTVLASDPATIDDLGLNSVTDDELFSPGFRFEGRSVFSYGEGNSITLESSLVESANADSNRQASLSSVSAFDLDGIESSYRDQGLKIKRLSSSWQTEAGTLTVEALELAAAVGVAMR